MGGNKDQLCAEDVFVEKVERAAEASPESKLCCKCSKKPKAESNWKFWLAAYYTLHINLRKQRGHRITGSGSQHGRHSRFKWRNCIFQGNALCDVSTIWRHVPLPAGNTVWFWSFVQWDGKQRLANMVLFEKPLVPAWTVYTTWTYLNMISFCFLEALPTQRLCVSGLYRDCAVCMPSNFALPVSSVLD